MRRFAVLTGAFVVGVCMTACVSKAPGRYNLILTVDQSIRDHSMKVDLIGVNQTDAAEWRRKSMSEYFAYGDRLRKDCDRKTFTFGQGSTAAQTLSKQDPIWDVWERTGSRELFILADLTGITEDLPGEQDARRLILPLAQNRWARPYRKGFLSSKQAPLDIKIESSRVRCLTPPLPPEN